MKCPFCKTTLVKGEEKQFTNTSDHVFDPNHEYERPVRKTYICPNQCELGKNGFWDEQGGWYSGDVDYKKVYEWKTKNGSTASIGSWDRWMDKKQKFARDIYPYIFWGKYKMDISYQIANKIFKVIEPKFFQDNQ